MSVNKTSQAYNSGNAFLYHLPSRITIKNNVSTDLHFVYISAHHTHATCTPWWLKSNTQGKFLPEMRKITLISVLTLHIITKEI